MSKESRRRQRTAGQSSATGPGDRQTSADRAGACRRPSCRQPTEPRAGRSARRASAGATASFIERNRTWLLAAIAIVAVVAIAGVGDVRRRHASRPSRVRTIWEPTATSTPADRRLAAAGLRAARHGQHATSPTGTIVTLHLLPASIGRHYNGGRHRADRRRASTARRTRVIPQGWIHNLEHGGLVILYRGDGEADRGQALLRRCSTRSRRARCAASSPAGSAGPVVRPVRRDGVAVRGAGLGSRAAARRRSTRRPILEFDARFGERTNPEKFCEPSAERRPPASARERLGGRAPAASRPRRRAVTERRRGAAASPS